MIPVEDIQDIIEEQLMDMKKFELAKKEKEAKSKKKTYLSNNVAVYDFYSNKKCGYTQKICEYY